jgi:multiple sugar transport system substrate-binding protein
MDQVSRRWFIGGAAALAGSLAVTACSGTPVGSGAKTTLKYLVNDDPAFVRGTQAMIQAFVAQNGGEIAVQLEAIPFSQMYQKIQTSIAVGSPWDVIMADGPVMKNYIHNKVLAPLDEYITAEDKKQWPERLVANATSQDGKFFGPPIRDYAPVMFYNKTLMRNGIKPPTEPGDAWTVEEAMAAFQDCTVRSGAGANPSVWGIWPAQSDVFGPDSTIGGFRRGAGAEGSKAYQGLAADGITVSGYFDAPEAIEGYKWIQSLFTRGVSPVQPIPGMFESGQAAFCFAPDSTFGKIEEAAPGTSDNFGITPLPVFPGTKGVTHIGSYHYSVLAGSKNKAAAAEFIKFAAGKEGTKLQYEIIKQLPAHLELLQELPEYQPGGAKALFPKMAAYNGRTRLETPGYSEFSTIHNKVAGDIARGADVAERMRAGAQEMDAQMAKYAGWKTS